MMIRSIAFLATALSLAAPAMAQDSWSGGYGASNVQWQGLYVGAHVGAGFGKASEQRTSGAIGGVAAGYNWQSDRFVAGVEADISSSDIAAKSATEVYRQDWLATVRGRAGLTFGNLLPYVTAGPAFVGTGYRSTGGSKNTTATGWVAGAGAELYLTRSFSLKGEILHYGLSEEKYPASTGTKAMDPTSNVVRGGVNYRF